MRMFAALLFIALLACAPVQTTVPPPAESASMTEPGTIYIGSTVVAGPNQTPQKNFGVYVVNGVIREVGPAVELQRAHPRVNVLAALNSTILPGLTDAHGHL